MEGVTLLLVAVVLLAVVFDYINGFHDTANAIATSVATRALHPRHAIAMAAAFNFIGAFAGTAVAKTIGSGLVQEATTTQTVVIAAFVGAIVWNLVTWAARAAQFEQPCPDRRPARGDAVAAGVGAYKVEGIVAKVGIPMIASPIIGFLVAFSLMLAMYWIFRNARRRPLGRVFRRLQVVSAGFMAFSHGSNDAQKTMGIITLALFAGGVIPDVTVPVWVIVVAATALSLGTAVGGWRIMKTMGHRVAHLEPVHGFAAETTAATILFTTAHFGIPVSTTHVISSAIMGVGSSRGPRGVRWGVARNILVAWVVTIPASAGVAAITWTVLHFLGLG